jgi:hypothetical protein
MTIALITTLGYGNGTFDGSVAACTMLGFSAGEAAPVQQTIGWSGRPGANLRGRARKPTARKAPPSQPPLAAANQNDDNADWDYWKEIADKRRQDAAARKARAEAKVVEKSLGIRPGVVEQPKKAPAKSARPTKATKATSAPATRPAFPVLQATPSRARSSPSGSGVRHQPARVGPAHRRHRAGSPRQHRRRDPCRDPPGDP